MGEMINSTLNRGSRVWDKNTRRRRIGKESLTESVVRGGWWSFDVALGWGWKLAINNTHTLTSQAVKGVADIGADIGYG